jgi:hypothetical protein
MWHVSVECTRLYCYTCCHITFVLLLLTDLDRHLQVICRLGCVMVSVLAIGAIFAGLNPAEAMDFKG